MKVSVIVDEDLVERAKQLTAIQDTDELIYEALRTLIRLHEQAEARELRGKLHWEGDVSEK